MKTNWFKRTLCSILAFVMVLGYVPVPTFAAETDGLCAHHTQHTEACGYSAAVEGHDCGHAHTDECYQSVTECVHSHGDCGYVAAVEGHSCDCQPAENGEIIHTEGCGYVEAVAEVLCGHVCSEETGCVTKMLNCQHQHDDTCGYAEAAAETPCGFECSDCAKEAADKESANRVAALITALPTVDAVKAKPMEAQEVDYNQVQAAYDAYSELTDEQKTLISNAEETFEALFDYFNTLVVTESLSSGTPDTTAPVLIDIELSVSAVTAPGEIEVILEATDDVSGAEFATVEFFCEATEKSLSVYLESTYYDESTHRREPYPDGKMHGTLEVGQYVAPGNFILNTVYLHDNAGNTMYYHRGYVANPDSPNNNADIPDELSNLQFVVSASNTPDTTAPELVDIKLSASTVAAPGEIEVIVEATDDVSGAEFATVEFFCEATEKSLSVYLESTYYDESTHRREPYPDGKMHGTLEVGQYVAPGNFILNTVYLHDNAGNTMYYHRGYVANPDSPNNNAGISESLLNIQFTVTNNPADVITSVTNPNFITSIEQADNNAFISADYSGSTVLPSEAFSAITGTDKTLDLVSEGITWRFEGKDITQEIKPINLMVDIKPVEQDTTSSAQGIQQILEGAPAVVMKFPENGTLPGKATIQVKVDYAMRQYLGSDTGLSVYYFNNQTGELELIASDLKVINDTYVEFPITHCSYYVLTANTNAATNGSCGDDLTWNFDEGTGILTISGTGAMDAIGFDSVTGQHLPPWKDWQDRIKSVVIESGVTDVADQAFGSCKNLETIVIPETVKKLGDFAILYCPSLKEIQVDDGNQYYCTVEGVLYSKDMATLIKYPACRPGTEYTVPDTVTKLMHVAFDSASKLVSITLPDNITVLDTDTFADCTSLKNIRLPKNLTGMKAGCIFWNCSSLESIEIPDNVQIIGSSAFAYCQNLKQVTLPAGLKKLDGHAFGHCENLEIITIPEGVNCLEYQIFEGSGLKSIIFEGDAPSFHEETFTDIIATVYYPRGNTTWIETVMQDYGGNITWESYGSVENRVTMDATDLLGYTSVWIDGKEYALQTIDNCYYVDLPDGSAETMVAYTYHVGDASDIHTQYPTAMRVWTLANEDGIYTATRIEELDNVLQYSGSSIRITGNKGIRMITSVNQDTRNALTGNGLAGFKLLEYGTLLAQTSKLGNNPLVLGGANVKSNYAYKKGVADPVFKYAGDLIQYTNVLVGFKDDQCAEDIAMRPYMKLLDENGEEFVIYGGIVYRSIGYIAYQNRNAFQPRSAAYEYVWSIIHNVYGTKYDSEYRK